MIKSYSKIYCSLAPVPETKKAIESMVCSHCDQEVKNCDGTDDIKFTSQSTSPIP